MQKKGQKPEFAEEKTDEEMQEIMGRPLPWAPGLPLRAAGFEADFYMKD